MKLKLPFCTAVAAIALGWNLGAATSPSAPPNVVILYADDMGFGDLRANWTASKIPTPHLDRLAAEGMRFTDAHSSSGICTPSRYALLTGRYHWRKFHGIVNSFDPPVFDPAEVTLPELLQANGYRTACIGKWHLGWNWSDIRHPDAKPTTQQGPNPVYAPTDFDWSQPISGGPLSHGFEYYFGDDVPNFPPYAWFENDRVITVPSEPLTVRHNAVEGNWEARGGPMTPDWDFYAVMPRLVERAEAWIHDQTGRDTPFFLYVPFTSPHAPIVPTPEFTGSSGVGGYGDFVVQTDDAVGRILDALAAAGFAENTLVIFSSDNGAEHYAFDRLQNYGHSSSGPFRGIKRDTYEGGHRVPMLVRWPGRVTPGSVHPGLVSQIDVMATLADVLGVPLPAGVAEDSYSLLPTLTGAADSPRQELVHNTAAGAFAIRSGPWVLIHRQTPEGHPGSHNRVPSWYHDTRGYTPTGTAGELFNLTDDEAQVRNLYAEQTAKVDELKALLARLKAQGQVR